jgi:hypothetical protein
MNNKDLKFLVESETLKIVHEILGIKNNSQELDMQDATASSIKNRGVATVEKNPKKDKKLNQQNREEADKEKTEDEKDSEEAKNSDEEKQSKSVKGTKDSPKLSPSLATLMNPTLEDILNAVSLVRGGKSANKNSKIRKTLEKYFDELTNPEKRTLSAFIFGIAQVLSDYETDDPLDPDDVGVKITSTKDSDDLKKRKKSNNDVSSVQKNNLNNPVIVVGERANKDIEMMILASYKRN